jgi:hypothetical protein
MIRKLIKKFTWFLIQKTCNHNNKKIIFECYQDRYIKYSCNDCKSIIYEDL